MATAKKAASTAAKIRGLLTANPNMKVSDIAQKMNVSPAYVYQVKTKMGNPTPKTPKKWKITDVVTSNEPAMPFKEEAERIYELTKGRQRMHPVTGKMLMQGMPMIEDKVTMEEPKADNVNNPAHYKVGGIETIDFIEAKQLNYHLGNVVKYITRADTKGNREEDLLKARWYLNREIAKFTKVADPI